MIELQMNRSMLSLKWLNSREEKIVTEFYSGNVSGNLLEGKNKSLKSDFNCENS